MNGNETITVPLLLIKRALGIGIPVSIEALMQLRAEAERPEAKSACVVPPPGWRCTRGAGHDGPCAAVQIHPSGETERAAPKAYADACSDRGQQTARICVVPNCINPTCTGADGVFGHGFRTKAERDHYYSLAAQTPTSSGQQTARPISFEDDIKSKDW